MKHRIVIFTCSFASHRDKKEKAPWIEQEFFVEEADPRAAEGKARIVAHSNGFYTGLCTKREVV